MLDERLCICLLYTSVTNLGKYNEGMLVGEWVKLPTTEEEMQNVFERIGIGKQDEFGQPYDCLLYTSRCV